MDLSAGVKRNDRSESTFEPFCLLVRKARDPGATGSLRDRDIAGCPPLVAKTEKDPTKKMKWRRPPLPHSFRAAVRFLTQQIYDAAWNRAATRGVVTASRTIRITIAAAGPEALPHSPAHWSSTLSPRIARTPYQQHTSSVPRGSSLRQS
jgi:hypothetical protein